MRTHPLRRPRLLLCLVAAVAIPAVLLVKGCGGAMPRRDPTGQTFPAVVGRSLEKQPKELPAVLAGRPAILLVGYRQSAQFDIDRWLMGFLQHGIDAQIVEVPTIPALVPTIASKWIDDGMRAGIPPEDWGAVVTLYGSAARPVAELTGTQNGQVARVLVLDPRGRIVWFDDEGYSPRKVIEIADRIGRDSDG